MTTEPIYKSWPKGSLISIVGHVLADGKIDFSVCLVVEKMDESGNLKRKFYTNKKFPCYDLMESVQDIYEQQEYNHE